MNLKVNTYNNIVQKIKALLNDETRMIPILANMTSIIKLGLKDVGWVGFFIIEDDELVLGPFQGKPAATKIKIGNGVCGIVALEKKEQVIKDVRLFPGHLACDLESNSEICIPILVKGMLKAVIDIDSPMIGRFDEDDLRGLQEIVKLLASTNIFN